MKNPSDAYLESEGTQFEHKLHREKDCKYDIENIEELSVQLGLIVEFHGKTESVDQNHGKDRVFKDRGSNKRPKFVLYGIFGNIPPHRFGI